MAPIKNTLSALLRKWCQEFKGYTTDGKVLYCQPCQNQVPIKQFSSYFKANVCIKII